MGDNQQPKSELRGRIRRVLTGVAPEVWPLASAAACTRLIKFIARADGGAGVVLFYMATARELDVGAAAQQCLRQGTEVCLPRADWNSSHITPARVSSWGREELVETRHGILEPGPAAEAIDLARLDLVVVPGLAFDAAGGRLGKGGGFYDRFLSQPGLRATKVGVALDEQVVEAVPRDAWDVALDALVTPTRTMVFGRDGGR